MIRSRHLIKICAAAFVSGFILASSVEASLFNLGSLHNTGVDGTGAPLGTGAADPHYSLLSKPAADPNTTAVVINHGAFPVAPGPWIDANATSRWIGATSGAGAFAGTYVYRTSFDLSAEADFSKVRVSGIWSADDAGTASISINGNPTGIAPPAGFGAFSPTWTIGGGFVAGTNHIDFSVPDTAPATGGCCTGLRVEIQEFGYDIGLYNTGVDGTRAPLADNAADSHWLITSAPTLGGPLAATSAGGFPIGPWVGDNSTSAWIVPTIDTSGLAGDYRYETSFDLTFIDPSTVSISGRMSVDNSITDILLNGVSTGNTGAGFGGWTTFSIDASGGDVFNSGNNTLAFLVNNAGTPPYAGPIGLRVEFLDVNGTFIPEPTTILIWSLLAGLGVGLGWRRRK